MPLGSAEKSAPFVPVPPSKVSAPPLQPKLSFPPEPTSVLMPGSPVSESEKGEPVTFSRLESVSWPASFVPIADPVDEPRFTATPSALAEEIELA